MLTEDEKGRRENPVCSCLIYDPTNSLWNVNASFIIMLLLCAHIHAIYSISIFLFMLISHCRERLKGFLMMAISVSVFAMYENRRAVKHTFPPFLQLNTKKKFFFCCFCFFTFWVSMRKGFSRFSDDISRQSWEITVF